ncbi:hypothetical protein HK405_016046, partial [Cladochytrium tenue]
FMIDDLLTLASARFAFADVKADMESILDNVGFGFSDPNMTAYAQPRVLLDTLSAGVSAVVALAKTSESSRRGSLRSAAPAFGNPTKKSLAAPVATFKGRDRYGQVAGANPGMNCDTEGRRWPRTLSAAADVRDQQALEHAEAQRESFSELIIALIVFRLLNDDDGDRGFGARSNGSASTAEKVVVARRRTPAASRPAIATAAAAAADGSASASGLSTSLEVDWGLIVVVAV